MSEQHASRPSDEDLREPLRGVLGGWRWIAVSTLVAATTAAILSLRSPEMYEATAIVAVTEPGLSFQPDPALIAQVRVPQTLELVDFVHSDNVLAGIISAPEVAELRMRGLSAVGLRESLEARASSTLLTLTATSTDPRMAVVLVNSWANAATDRINEVYAPTSSLSLDLRDMESEALEQWQARERELAEFDSVRRRAALSEGMEANLRILAAYIGAIDSLALVKADTRALVLELQRGDLEGEVPRDQHMLATLLTMRSLRSSAALVGGSLDPATSGDLQVLFAREDGAGGSRGDLVEKLEELTAQIEKNEQDLVGRIISIEREIGSMEADLIQIQQERSALEADSKLAMEYYLSLARRSQAEGSELERLQSVARIAGHASAARGPTGANTVTSTVIGAAMGLLVGIAFTTLREWWRIG